MRQIQVLAFALPVLLTACVTMPKNTAEFRQWSVGRKGTHQFTVNSPLESVIERINAHADKCLRFGKSFTRTEGMGGNPAPMKSSSEQLTRWEKSKSDNPSFVITTYSPQVINQPPGGTYLHLTDLVRRGNQTLVKMNDGNPPSWAMYDYTTELTAVIKGEKSTCQLEKIK